MCTQCSHSLLTDTQTLILTLVCANIGSPASRTRVGQQHAGKKICLTHLTSNLPPYPTSNSWAANYPKSGAVSSSTQILLVFCK